MYVYVLEDPQRPGWCKVGIAQDVVRRVSQLRCAAPGIRRFREFKVRDRATAREIEKLAHRTLQGFGKKREWFAVDPRFGVMHVEGAIEEIVGEVL